jgi:hypothetical protein
MFMTVIVRQRREPAGCAAVFVLSIEKRTQLVGKSMAVAGQGRDAGRVELNG